MSKTIYGLLAMAVTTSLALASGGGGGGEDDKKDGLFQDKGGVSFKPGSGITFDGGDDFRLNLRTIMQIQFNFVNYDNKTGQTAAYANPVNTFAIRRIETAFSGNAYSKDLTYKLNVDWAKNPGATGTIIKDAWAQFQFMDKDDYKLAVRTGQSKTYFGLESTGSVGGLYFIERSSATNTFANSRSRGAWLFGSGCANKVRWNAGVENADVAKGAGVLDVGEDTNNPDNELSWIANVSWDPWGDIMGGKTNEAYYQGDLAETKDLRGTVGGGVQIGNNKVGTATGADVKSNEYNFNALGMMNGFAGMAEFYGRTDDPTGGAKTNSNGWYVQGTYTLPKSGASDMQWGFGVRYSVVHLSDAGGLITAGTTMGIGEAAGMNIGAGKGDVNELSFGVDMFYHGHNAKTQFTYTIQNARPDPSSAATPDHTNNIFQVGFQLIF